MCRDFLRGAQIFYYAAALLFLFHSDGIASARDGNRADDNDWYRVHSANGEFSIEVPRQHSYVFDKEGFLVTRNLTNFELRDMNMLNAYFGGSLLSIETYRATKDGLEGIFESDKEIRGRRIADLDVGGVRVRQILVKDDKYYLVRQYFNTKTHIYILTAASRNGETPAIKRFLESLAIQPADSKSDLGYFPNLKARTVKIHALDPKPKNSDKAKSANAKKDTPDDNSALLIVNKQKPAYTDAARANGIQGDIELRVTFSADAFVPDIGVVKGLSGGLTRQAIFAGLRLKFLPKEENGKPVGVSRPVTYKFSIY